PDGTVYRGNNFAPFALGRSLAGGTFDTTNVEEAVILKNAMVGDWSVRIIGANVPVGPQPFALVATGSLDGSYGRLTLNRPVYSEADTVRIAVEDSDATSVVVHAMSSVEPAGEDVVLTSAGSDGLWRGTIATRFGSASPDGVLQVRDGDTISFVYQDLSPAHVATARATILASGPTIHDVRVTDIGSRSATVHWTTDEPASAEVRYGTSPSALTSTANLSELRVDHAIALTGLAADMLYYFDASSGGRLGNTTLDANSGSDYSFHTAPMGDILLVVGGSSFPPEREASYAAALDGTGWTWSVWRVADDGLPPLSVLRAARAVVWQVGLEQYPPFNTTARALVKSYLDGGGRLLVSSHDTAWSLGNASSPFASPESEAWVRGVLKATFSCDPVTISGTNGVASDPISGAYTGGVPYTPHRDGGADDQITTNAAGGTSSTVWTDGNLVQGCANNRPVGLRWVSSSANGTAGTGAWGGAPSRLVYFAFELTGLDTTSTTNLNPNSPTRAVVLDAALRWLVGTATSTLDRDHPDVAITSPNGGTFTGSTIAVNWTANAYGTGIGLANFTLRASADGGQTWSGLATLPGTARSYLWTLGSTPNGNRYRMAIVAQDDGTPSLSGENQTAATFAINRVGGDNVGPVLWAGSVRVAPKPPGAGALATFTATADDRSSGGSSIGAAELFLRTAPPAPGDTGTGLAMTAVDGTFDTATENVSWQGGLAAPPGVSCGWIHALDVAGNWGPYGSVCFVVISIGPDTVPPGPAALEGLRLANASTDLSITWLPAWDEGLYGGTTEYHVWRSTSPRGTYADISGPIVANGSARYVFVDVGRAVDAPDYFYRIETLDAANNSAISTAIVGKTHILFLAGLNLLGMPVDLTDPRFGALASGRAWADAWTYDACSGGIGWTSAIPSDAVTFSLPSGRGFWVNGTTSDFVLALGRIARTSQIRLCAGWNLVALPGFATGITVGDLRTATGADAVMGFDPAGPYHLRSLADAMALAIGQGYWVHVRTNATWTVAGW
ncbi:MAG TPA: fibronectin type III domain-containing protein, partial [Thermoplasmata archaeon]|nr:fibronectin type III domain-containing protein [Thermoplasmata archaeon]